MVWRKWSGYWDRAEDDGKPVGSSGEGGRVNGWKERKGGAVGGSVWGLFGAVYSVRSIR